MPAPASLFWSYLNLLTKERYDALREVFGGLEEAKKCFSQELLEKLGCREETVQKSLMRMEEFDVERYAAALEKKNIRFLEIIDAAYPDKLRQIGDPPPFLYSRGDLGILEEPCVGLVGTRQMTRYGRRVTEHFTQPLVAAGLVTVSGLAAGVDALVAEETLRAGGKTVAVLGHGLSRIYPRENEKLAEEIVEAGGLLLSEFPLDADPGKHTFPARNRIIAGLSLGTVVLEAPLGSGAIITADLALEYGRDVFAVPGDIFDPSYAGCHEILARGSARLVTDAAAVLRELGMVVPENGERTVFTPDDPDQAAVYALLTSMPQDMDALTARSSLDVAVLNATLTMLELQGAVKNVGNGQWVRA